jgi:putative Mg2+ transporter-C (MgtC) family protein
LELDDLPATVRDFVIAILPQVRDLSIAYALAFVLGWNRERRGHSAGLRTFPLVAIASCGFVQAAETMVGNSPEALARVVEGVITGIGFIGAGAILKGGTHVHGTATAASIWVTGAIGAAIGLGSYQVAVTLCLFAAVTLYMISRLKPDRVEEDEAHRATLAAEDRDRE